ncbi:hypothetical protein H5410_016860 [Solanum commersonii]|uniref:Short-chain dehydrogenase n=1 Tax=Solanum commersonii TaxID=4109 RepID=A0A9J5ZYL6_SOLCO|nr:hypothetical protein H5410_016860 [Solanum commersonii]
MWLFKKNGPSGFSYSSTAEEVTHGLDGSGLTAIVTGASSGIGAETSRVLALRGVHVIMAVRNMTAGKDVKEAILKEIPAAKVDVMELDLSSFDSVKKFAADFISSGHFLLTNLLLEKMKETACETKREGRVVNVASDAHYVTYPEGIRFDKINDQESYRKFSAYGQSKMANILSTYELAKCLKEDGVEITANSLNPGAISSNLFRHMTIINGNNFPSFCFLFLSPFHLVPVFKLGASTTCYIALNPQVKGVSGEYFQDNNLATPSKKARDMDLAKKLWDFSMDLVK